MTLRGFTTVTFFADDLDAARAWYTGVFESEPYFVRDGAYLEWRVGDYQHEFGVLNSRFAPHPHGGQASGAIVYWAVDDVEAAYQRLLGLGATPHDKPTERGPGYVTASVLDPFGNVLGVMLNQHYQDVLAAVRTNSSRGRENS
ncbi:putative enzyme related to lactoylglutathione lyase [Actinoplanes lutulentus]|uniref:Putative glyoxalase superfamily protein PhnB n=1 Tax=Actinoplanes lutulentus TaxID=1287878 RepID=A0A327ZFD8_9ACTN|nr:VOC family protein [Actinoplanes lutulentus]MBB2946725.1 putative enzyme related to lactoylglutathione lyase [Actinoplanes lutulentus]RAK35617.1 putative glyoxalase superfamily protein PhnB [Actinoplanes lutulentus]